MTYPNTSQVAQELVAGVITQYAGTSSNLPPGALECDGSTFSATTYPALAAVLGGTTLPNIPGSIVWTGGPLP